MGSFSDVLENLVIDHVFKNAAFTSPSTIAMALGTAASDSSFTELPNTQNYGRATASAANWNTAASRSISNSASIIFPKASGSWGTPTHWALFDSATYGAGNYLAYGSITTPTEVVIDNSPSFRAGLITISFNAHVSNVGWGTAYVNKLLDHSFRNVAEPQPTNLYVGYGTTPLTDGVDITGEASGGGYARVNHNDWDVAGSGAPLPGQTANSSNIEFTVSGAWTADVDVVFLTDDAASSLNANLIAFSTITSFTVSGTEDVVIITGDLDVTLS